jgi:Domain of unknown function (DUF4259)
MGTWGTGPFDNDTAGDIVAKMMVPIHKVLDLPISVPVKNRSRGKSFRSISSDYYEEARFAAAIILFSHDTDILGGPRLQLVLDALKKMRSDDQLAEAFRFAIDKQIRAVQRKIRICGNRKKRVKSARRPGRVLCRKRH